MPESPDERLAKFERLLRALTPEDADEFVKIAERRMKSLGAASPAALVRMIQDYSALAAGFIVSRRSGSRSPWPEAFFNRLYRDFHESLRSNLRRLGADESTSEDVLAEAFTELWNGSADSFRTEKSFRPWLWTVVWHKFVDHVRKRKKEFPVAPDELPESDPDEEEAGLPSDDARRLWILATASVFESLSGEDQELIRLRDFEELSTDKIAEQKGLTVEQVYRQVFRARKRVREELETLVNQGDLPDVRVFL